MEKAATRKKAKAIALLSGGLDSTLAVKIMLDMGIDVEAVNFKTIFCTCDRHTEVGCRSEAARVAEEFGIKLVTQSVTEEYLQIVKNPRFGYGRNVNPCIDCRIFFFTKAKEYMEEVGADFIVTGEVVAQRPKSQHKKTLTLIEKESGLEGRIVRPLSARLLPPTIAEEQGIVDRERLLAFSGRSRKPQMKLAEELGVNEYPCAAGGCKLTDPNFAARFKDLMIHEPDFKTKDVVRLFFGRHFRVGGYKVIVGRNEKDNRYLTQARRDELLLEVRGFSSPLTLVDSPAPDEVVRIAAGMTARYSDGKNEPLLDVTISGQAGERTIQVPPLDDAAIRKLMI